MISDQKIRMFLTLVLFFLNACTPTVTKHIRVQRHIDKKPSSPFEWPLDAKRTLSKFGERGKGFHTGVDLQRNRKGGDVVRASRSGRVMSVGWVRGYGRQITIHHSDGYRTRYAHLNSVSVRLGQQVQARQAVGTVGKTGRASTPHLHFEVTTPDGFFIDPLLLLP